jgi:glutamate-5-semialdehyde dehydrogenase
VLPAIKPAAPGDFGQEFLSLIASVKVVDSLDEALDFVAGHGSGHSEAIVTEDTVAAERFLNEVDAAAVFANASTRFNDGGEFGLGAEVAISTNKFHARGPMGLREITSYKWVVRGDGQVRA